MTGIWRKDGDTWSLIGPADYSNEQELHDRIVEAPEMLPLSGQPDLVAPYREVPLGGGSADVLAFESNGRPVIIEVKLSKNPEAKRPVVAQTLAYAAWLHGATIEELEEVFLARHLAGSRLADAIEKAHGEGTIDREEFHENLAAHLDRGSFRLVIVLDDAPTQLVRLMGYLETITTDQITIDLVTVTAYEVNGAQILVPQRIEPGRDPEPDANRGLDRRRPSRRSGPLVTEGSDRFRDAIEELVTDQVLAKRLRELTDWAERLAGEGLVRLDSGEGKRDYTLRLHLPDETATIAVLCLPSAAPENHYIWIQLGVTSRRAPNTRLALARAAGLEEQLERGNGAGRAEAITPELLDALTAAYREAAGKD